MPPVGVLRPEASPIIPSARDVLPLPRCPIRHTFLMVSVSTATDSSSHELNPFIPRAGHVAYPREAVRAGQTPPITGAQAPIAGGRKSARLRTRATRNVVAQTSVGDLV